MTSPRTYSDFSQPWWRRVLLTREMAVIVLTVAVVLYSLANVPNFDGPLTVKFLLQDIAPILLIALGAGVLCVLLTTMLLWSSRELRLRQQPFAGQLMELSGMLILAMPGIVLATGFFLLLNDTLGLPQSADGIVIFTNALMAVPYAMKVLENPLRDIAERYSRLCLALDIRGLNRLRLIELAGFARCKATPNFAST